jgi:hypothetical protein
MHFPVNVPGTALGMSCGKCKKPIIVTGGAVITYSNGGFTCQTCALPCGHCGKCLDCLRIERSEVSQGSVAQPTIEQPSDLITIANRTINNPDWRSADLYNALLEAFRLGVRLGEQCAQKDLAARIQVLRQLTRDNATLRDWVSQARQQGYEQAAKAMCSFCRGDMDEFYESTPVEGFLGNLGFWHRRHDRECTGTICLASAIHALPRKKSGK